MSATLAAVMRRITSAIAVALAFWLLSSRATAGATDSLLLDPISHRSLYYDRDLAPGDLQGRSLRELSLMRNWIYARAGNPFRNENLDGFFEKQPWYKPAKAYDPGKLSDIDRRNANALARSEATIPADELKRRFERLAPDGGMADNASETDWWEVELLALRLGKEEWLNDNEIGRFVRTSHLDRQLTLKDLDGLSRRDLRILRNTIYARHGRPFVSEILQHYFGTLEWYVADPTYTGARLAAVDRRNINLIRGLEDRLGGPLKEGAHADSFLSDA